MADTNTITNLASQLEQATDIRDIRPLIEIPNPWISLWVGLAALALAGIGLWIWKRVQVRRSQEPGPPPPPAHLVARQRLEEALVLLGQPKLFVIAVSDALRAYLEDAFQLRAPEQTTEEFLAELRSSALLSEGQKTSLGDFLQSCDMVKFARYEPRETELRELHTYALELVAQTEPQPPPTDGQDPNRTTGDAPSLASPPS